MPFARVLRLLLSAAIGAGLGLASVYLALTEERLDLAERIGPWRVATAVGPQSNDPYAAARAARGGSLGLGPAEGVAFLAHVDSAGEGLDPRCHYEIAGKIPAGDVWTLTITDLSGRLPQNPAGRIGFTSIDVLREGNGEVVIRTGRTARSGNFIPTGQLESLAVTLRAYSSRLAASLPAEDGLPAIRRTECPAPGEVR